MSATSPPSSNTPTLLEVGRGFDHPVITQFSVFLPNRVGRMHEVVKAFEDNMVRICSMAVLDSTDHAVIRLIASSADGARAVLKAQNLSFMESSILVVCLEPHHSLAVMCQFLLSAELNIRFAYPLFAWNNALPTVALAVDDPTLAGQILRRKEFRLLGEADLPKFND